MTAGRIVEPGLGLEQAGKAPRQRHTRRTENTAAASVEDTMAPSSSASCQSTPSRTCAPAAVTAVLMPTPMVARRPAGASTFRTSANWVVKPALDEDDGQRRRAEILASSTSSNSTRSVLAEKDADQQEEQQAGKPDPDRHPGGDNAGQQHEATDQQRQVQLLQAHFVPIRRIWRDAAFPRIGAASDRSRACASKSGQRKEADVKRVDQPHEQASRAKMVEKHRRRCMLGRSVSADEMCLRRSARDADRDSRCGQRRPVRGAASARLRPQGPADRTRARHYRTQHGSRGRMVVRRRV